METPNNTTTQHISEAIVTEILARLPLRSISRFKSVCKTWKSTLESVYFRRLFVSLHQNISSSWSLLCGGREIISMRGCETWDLPKSLASYFREIQSGNLYYAASSSGLVLMNASDEASYVGNPVLQQWLRIPRPPHPSPPHPSDTIVFGFVTRLDKDGVVLDFKVVRLAALVPKKHTCLCLWVYSSETGIWTRKRLYCPLYITSLCKPMSLNGTLYVSETSLDDDFPVQPGVLIALDFYSESDLCRVIPLPDHNVNHNHNRDFKRALTASCGFVMYMKTLAQDGDNLLKVWRLNNDSGDECWQLLWGVRLPFDDIRNYAPITMHPFDGNIVYLWSQENRYLVSCNLQRQNYKILGNDGHQDFFINQSLCKKYMDETFRSSSAVEYGVVMNLIQFLLPKWMESLPRPPHVEMIDTASLLSYISSLPKEEEDEEDEEEEE